MRGFTVKGDYVKRFCQIIQGSYKSAVLTENFDKYSFNHHQNTPSYTFKINEKFIKVDLVEHPLGDRTILTCSDPDLIEPLLDYFEDSISLGENLKIIEF